VVSGRIGLRVKGLGFREQLFISVSQFLSFSVSQKKIILFFLLLLPAFGADAVQIPTVNLSLSAPDEPTQLVNSLNFIFIITLLILSPAIVFVMTSFLRLVVVFSFLKQAMGTQQMPPSQFMVSLALILTFFIMEPVATKAYEVGIKPYMEKKIGYEVAIENAVKPFKKFMLNNTREKDLALFYRIRNLENPKTIDDVPLTVIIPAFMISELKTAFEIGFLIYLPFLVIDMVVSSVLMSMGMMMLPPVMISLPFKLLIFVLIDGWNLLVGNLVESFK
jgi:flagellar biosynthetic protein FliP